MCRLDLRVPRLNIISRCICEIHIWTRGFSKVDCPSQYGWASSNPLGPEQNKRQRKMEFTPFSSSLSIGLAHRSSSALTLGLHRQLPWSQVCRLWLQLHYNVSSLETADGGLLCPCNHMNHFLMINLLYIYLSLVLLLWGTLTDTNMEPQKYNFRWKKNVTK